MLKKGHQECLKYARENGCPWDEENCRDPPQNDTMEFLKSLMLIPSD